ncbi:MAG: hypothetical protein RI932_967 [Pseudomonadota bacterium]
MLFIAGMLVLFPGCGKKSAGGESESNETLHLSLSARASTMLLGVTDAAVSEITLQRFNCPSSPEPTDYVLGLVQADKTFVLNEERSILEGCSLKVRNVKVKWKELTASFDAIKDNLTTSGTSETVLANASKSAFLNVVLPAKVGVAVDKNLFWSLNISYVDNKTRLFPLVAEAREPEVASLGLSVSRLEDRGVANSIWREFGISLSCAAPQAFGTCNGIDLMGVRARFVLQADVDTSVAAQIRYQGGLNDLQFTSALTHLVGSGLRFTLNMPVGYFGQRLYLIVMRGQSYSVFAVAPELVPTANQ